MTTYGAQVTKLRDRLDEATARQWSDDQLVRWLYDGAKDVARKTECLQTTSEVNAVANDQELTLPTDVVRVYRVEWRPGDRDQVYALEYRDFNTMDGVWWTSQLTSTGTPAIFTMWGFPPQLKMVVYPITPQTGVYKCFYYKLPTDPGVDTSQTLELPTGWEDLAVDYAEWYALRRDADGRWQEAKAMYDEHMRDLLVTAMRWTDQAGLVVPASGGFGVPRWLYDENWA